VTEAMIMILIFSINLVVSLVSIDLKLEPTKSCYLKMRSKMYLVDSLIIYFIGRLTMLNPYLNHFYLRLMHLLLSSCFYSLIGLFSLKSSSFPLNFLN